MEKKCVDDELEEMRCLIEMQQREIYRQQRRIELQRQRIDYIQAELDVINSTSAAPSHSKGNSRGNGDGNSHGNSDGNSHVNGTRHRVARSPRSETSSSSRRA
jgi:hypothetical protein